MTDGLTARQTQILKALTDEYINSAEPVGSEALDKKYNLGVSPATIRNEMVALTRMGYLKQPHTSAGRIPTPTSMKFYIDQLMEERQMSVTDEVRAKEDIWDARDDFDRLLQEATHALAEQTKSLAVAATSEGRLWHSGYANIVNSPEFSDMLSCANLFSFIEEGQGIHELFFERMQPESAINVLFGEELGWPELSPVGVVSAHFNVKGKSGAFAVIGPMGLAYSTVIPTVKYFKKLIEEVVGQ